MKTIGELFVKARLIKNIGLEEVEKETKIRKIYLSALEKGEYQKLPPAAFTRGFVKNYSEFLGLDTLEILALYRREFDEQKDRRLLPKTVDENLAGNSFRITPKLFSIFIVSFLLILFGIYIFLQYAKLSGAPALIIYSPSDNSLINNKEIEVSGKTDAEAVVKINGQIITNKDGKFSQTITLTEGLNTITIEAVGRNAKVAKDERHIRLLPVDR